MNSSKDIRHVWIAEGKKGGKVTVYESATNCSRAASRSAAMSAAMISGAGRLADSSSASAITLGKLQAGIELTRARDASKAAEIEAWVDLVAGTYNVLPMDGPAFRQWARLMHRKSASLYEDAMIAATAIVHKLTIVTRNSADFAALGIKVFDPFGDRPR